jgi:PKD repeat protein
VKQETHHAMKKLISFLTLLLLALGLYAQPTANDFWIHGTVTNSSTNNGIANKRLYIYEPAENGLPGFLDSTFTDANGYYSYVVWGGSTVGPNRNYYVQILDCQGSATNTHLMNNQGTTDVGIADFSICDNSALCQAGFTTQVQNNNPQGIYFLNASTVTTGQISSWCWDYGDGTTACNDPNINSFHNYANPGAYYVCLTIGTTAGCTSTFCDSIYIANPCAGLAGYTANTSPNSLTTTFVGTFDGVVNNQATYSWNYGDNTTGTGGPTNQHTYSTAGTYNACVTVTYNGCSDTYCQQITVGGCQAGFTAQFANGSLLGGFIATINGQISGGSFSWTFGDGGTSNAGPTAQYTYANPGTYQVCVTVAVNGCTSTYCDSVTVGGSNCDASFNPTLLNNTFTYNLNPTTPGGTWTITPGGFLLPDPNGIVTFPNAGSYYICYTAPGTNGTSCTQCDSLVVGNPNGGCTAGFTMQVNGSDSLGWVFVGSFNGQINNQATYTWDFGDNNVGTGGPTTQHYYQTPGTYTVCVTVSYNGCTATFCDVVYAGGNVVGACDATFSYTWANLLSSFFFVPVNTDNTYSHLWDFGDGTQSTQQSPIHTFSGNGVYLVCHTLFNNNGCQDTECYNVTINDSTNTGCQAYYYATPVNNPGDLNIQFTDYSTSGNPSNGITNWQWSFGDGTSSTLQNPTHDYSVAGTYVVCLTVWNNSGCQSQYCDSIVVGGNNQNNIISGNVYTSVNTPASVAYVFLLRFDYPNSQLVPEGADVTSNGYYIFNNVPNGDYVVKAALTPNDPLYAVRIPTYHTAAMLWNFGDVITINNNSYTTGDIYMIAAANQGGPGFIGGTVDWADTLRAATDFSGATVILQTIAGENIAFAVADANGAYSFSNLAYGTYKLYADFPGYTGDPTFVTLTPITDSIADAQVLLGPANLTGVEETSVIDGISLYPNPTTDNATLVVETSKTSQLSLTVVNMVGQVVGSQTINAYAGKNIVQLNTDNLAQGVYTLVLRDSKGVAKAQRLIKQ